MSFEKITLGWKIAFAAAGSILLLCISGCGYTGRPDSDDMQAEQEERLDVQGHAEDTDRLIDICGEFYENYAGEAEKTSPEKICEKIRDMIDLLGRRGYAAVDRGNQINMTQAEQVVRFCEAVDAGEEGDVTIIEVIGADAFITYDLQTKDGKVDVDRSCYEYEDGAVRKTAAGSYEAQNWQYTKEGYVMFSGHWFSEERYVLTMSEAEEYAAFRVQPLDETYREWNRQYVLPIGYRHNNMFLIDWKEDDFGALDFYDLYDIFYPLIYGQPVPYPPDERAGVGAVYQIPEGEFERVIQAYLDIDSETLRSKTAYLPDAAAYEYKPRGFYEGEYPEYPYPEVVEAAENGDGTVTLTVHVVFPYAGLSKVYAHEVVVCPSEDGMVRYVSNRIVASPDNGEETWYTPRLTQEQWEDVYGARRDCLMTEEERERLQDMALGAADLVKAVYREAETEAADSGCDAADPKSFTKERRSEIVSLLGQAGFISVTEGCNMENPESIQAFYNAYLKKQDAMFTVFEVRADGQIDVMTMLYRGGRLQMYDIAIGWQEGGIPELLGTSVNNVAEIKLTEKGYFIYTYETVIAHGSLRQYWRAKPLSGRCRELTETYIAGLSYVNYNMLVTNWDSGNAEDILMPCMFEDIYRIHTGKNLKVENWEIPAQLYEEVMTTYFPVSEEKVRQYCGYRKENGSYRYEMIFAGAHPPFGEVVDYAENEDGTITLIVDAVWPDYNTDRAFTNEIVVRPFADGTFRYLSNTIEQKELALPPVAGGSGP